MGKQSIYTLLTCMTAMGAMLQGYFPSGALSAVSKMDGIKAEWYSKELVTLQEPSLWQSSRKQRDAEVYRFLWLRSFDAPICVRITVNHDGTALLISKEGTLHGGAERGKLARSEMKLLSAEQVKAFRGLIVSVKFWTIHNLLAIGVVSTVRNGLWKVRGRAPTRLSTFDPHL